MSFQTEPGPAPAPASLELSSSGLVVGEFGSDNLAADDSVSDESGEETHIPANRILLVAPVWGSGSSEDLVDAALHLIGRGADMVSFDADQFALANRSDLPAVLKSLHARNVRTWVRTASADVAIAVVSAGVAVLEDPSGGDDPFMAPILASSSAQYVLPSIEGDEETLQMKTAPFVKAGVAFSQLAVDVTDADQLQDLSKEINVNIRGTDGPITLPHFFDAARISLLRSLVAEDADVHELDAASVAVSVLAASRGAWAIRVRDVERTAHALFGTPLKAGSVAEDLPELEMPEKAPKIEADFG